MTAPGTTVPDEPPASAAPGLTITCVNPLEHAEEIKRLFLAHDRPEFPAFFDRAYADAVAAGTRSWIGRDSAGRIRAHIAWFPRWVAFDGKVLRAALLGNLMVATPYRRFWPALALVRRAVRDLRQSGSLDFVYADPNETATPVLTTAGLRGVGSLQRFVLPLTDRRSAVAIGIRIYHLLGRLQAGTTTLTMSERLASDDPEPTDLQPRDDPRSLRPIRTASLYRARLGEYPDSRDRWYTFHLADAAATEVGRALVRGPDHRGFAVICALQWEPTSALPAILIALSRRLRESGATRLEVSLMAASSAARALRRAGFLPRADRLPVLAVAFTERGTDAVLSASEWRILPVDLDR